MGTNKRNVFFLNKNCYDSKNETLYGCVILHSCHTAHARYLTVGGYRSLFFSLSSSSALSLEYVGLIGHVDGPPELVPLRFVEDLLDWDVKLFAPCYGNTGIEIVQLGRAQGNRLVLVLVSLLQFELLQLLLEAFQLLLLLVLGDLVADVALLEVLQFPLANLDRILFLNDLLLQIGHALLVRFRDGPLMVTQNGYGTVRPVVGQQFLRHGHVRIGQLGQLVLQREGRVERTEHLGGEAIHKFAQMLVHHGGV